MIHVEANLYILYYIYMYVYTCMYIKIHMYVYKKYTCMYIKIHMCKYIYIYISKICRSETTSSMRGVP